ncbi:MAG: twin-arginine translocation signal domain-containing protein, partial [Epsilonproteobacteria bacterium]|nr:twin-arginine translocation signal domain-containing protein [Campylobacterota bacterium]
MNREQLRTLFTSKSSRVNTNKGEEYYNNLYQRCKARLEELQKLTPVKNLSIQEILEDEGISRRDFLKWASATTAMLMLPSS